MGIGGGRRDANTTATPIDSRIMAPKLPNPDSETPNATSRSRGREAEGDGVVGERCKGTEQPERMHGTIASIFAAEAPQGRLRSSVSGRFFPAVYSIT